MVDIFYLKKTAPTAMSDASARRTQGKSKLFCLRLNQRYLELFFKLDGFQSKSLCGGNQKTLQFLSGCLAFRIPFVTCSAVTESIEKFNNHEV